MTAPDRVGGRHPAQTWPDCAVPTDAQLCDWIASFRPGDDPRVAAEVLRFRLGEKAAAMNTLRAHMADAYRDAAENRRHAEMLARLVESMADDVTRYKLAWTSARRRGPHHEDEYPGGAA